MGKIQPLDVADLQPEPVDVADLQPEPAEEPKLKEKWVLLQFRVPASVAKSFKREALEADMKLQELFLESFATWMKAKH